MSGNVLEWTQDWYDVYPSGSFTDPIGAGSGSGRVGRGGSWDYEADGATVSARYSAAPDYASHDIGFRLSRASP